MTIANLPALLDGGFIERYHIKGQRMLTRQSVAEHSWRMAAILYTIWPGCRVELLWAHLMHDVSERVTGDMPANIKWANPVMSGEVNRISTAEEERLGIRFPLDAEERRLLAWVDRYEGAVHCGDEIMLGNQLVVGTFNRYLQRITVADFRCHDHNRAMLQIQLARELTEKVEPHIINQENK